MRYPKTAILFEGITNCDADDCKVGEIYEYAGPSNQTPDDLRLPGIDHFDPFYVEDDEWERILDDELSNL